VAWSQVPKNPLKNWLPHLGKFRGRKHRPGPDFPGHNEGTTKCTGARARPEPRAAKPEPQATKHEAARERLSQSRFPIPAKHRGFVSVWVALSLLNFQAPHLILGRSSPAGSVEGESIGTKLGGSQ
jgi:hypothetical protein